VIDSPLQPMSDEPADLVELARERTPARVFTGRAGSSYRTTTILGLRQDHAAARDAVWAEVELIRDLGTDLVARFGLFEVQTRADSKEQFLLRPDLGRHLGDAGRDAICRKCVKNSELQIVIGDGLSAAAVAAQVPKLLPNLVDGARQSGWQVGHPFFVRHCRVGVLNDIGELLDPEIVVLLIGERPGLATAESLSAYMAYRPRSGHTDARRNLISNIHARGILLDEAIPRILALAAQMRKVQTSGVAIKEERPFEPAPPLPG
jgi:ethanolamine ammonia-lyase small subunit